MPKLLHATAEWLENIMPIWGWCAISIVFMSLSLINTLRLLPDTRYLIILLVLYQLMIWCVIYFQWVGNVGQKMIIQCQDKLIR